MIKSCGNLRVTRSSQLGHLVSYKGIKAGQAFLLVKQTRMVSQMALSERFLHMGIWSKNNRLTLMARAMDLWDKWPYSMHILVLKKMAKMMDGMETNMQFIHPINLLTPLEVDFGKMVALKKEENLKRMTSHGLQLKM